MNPEVMRRVKEKSKSKSRSPDGWRPHTPLDPDYNSTDEFEKKEIEWNKRLEYARILDL